MLRPPGAREVGLAELPMEDAGVGGVGGRLMFLEKLERARTEAGVLGPAAQAAPDGRGAQA